MKYENRNAYPITVPDRNGTLISIPPGGIVEGEHFSRFVTPRLLSPITLTEDRPTGATAAPVSDDDG